MLIRKLKKEDIPFVYKAGMKTREFHVTKVASFWSKKQLENWVRSKTDVLLVAKDSNKIVGFIFFALHIPTAKATFENIWIDPMCRNNGIASLLIERGFLKLKKLGCGYIMGFVDKHNKKRLRFFKKVGFHVQADGTWIDKEI